MFPAESIRAYVDRYSRDNAAYDVVGDLGGPERDARGVGDGSIVLVVEIVGFRCMILRQSQHILDQVIERTGP